MSDNHIGGDGPTAPLGVDDAVGVPARYWFAAIVNARHEKKVAEKLSTLGIETYVASQREIRIWKNGRKKEIDRVIIPSFVFVKCTEQQRKDIVKLPCINRFLVNRSAKSDTLSKPIATISDNDIQKLKFMLGQTDYHVDFEPIRYKVSDNVRVIRGSLMGLIGEVITTTDDAQTLTVVIDQLGCAKVTLPPQDLELLTP